MSKAKRRSDGVRKSDCVLVGQVCRGDGTLLPRVTPGRVAAVQGGIAAVLTPYGRVFADVRTLEKANGGMAAEIEAALTAAQETA